MRMTHVAAALAALTALNAGSALAAEGPWCAHITMGHDHVAQRCHFRTFEACRQEVVFEPSSFCVQNPAYNPQTSERPKQRRKAQSQVR